MKRNPRAGRMMAQDTYAWKLGRRAHRMGKPCIPAADPLWRALIKGMKVGEGAAQLAEAWVRGWGVADIMAG